MNTCQRISLWCTKRRSVRRVLFAFIISICMLRTGSLAMADEVDKKQSDTYAALSTYGIALVSGITQASTSKTKQTITGDQVKDSLNKMVSSYQTALKEQKAAVGMLDATFELAFTAVDVSSGGASLVATAPARWVKNQAMEAIKSEAAKGSERILAANLAKFKAEQGLDYESLRNWPIAERTEKIKAALDKIGLLSEVRGELGKDSTAAKMIEGAIVNATINTRKTELDIIAAQGHDIDASKKSLAKFGQELAGFTDKTEQSLERMDGQIKDVQDSLDDAQTSLSLLQASTQENTRQLRAVSGILFGKAAAFEKMNMLDAGYLQGELSDKQLTELKTVIRGELKKEQLVADIGRMVNTFNSIGQIARNLGVGGDLVPALSMARNVGEMVSSVASGNYLGAIVSVSGLFGGGAPDPDAQRHEELMSYLEKRFEMLDKKLDDIIQGQQKIIETLGKLSEQMALYDAALHDRLDRMEFKLDTIEDVARLVLFSPLNDCVTARKNILTGTGFKDPARFAIPNLKIATQIAAAEDFGQIKKCVTYLQGLYESAFDPLNLGLHSIAHRYFKTTPDGTKFTETVAAQKPEFFDKPDVQVFYKLYADTQEFVLSASVESGATPAVNHARSLSLLALPAHSVVGLQAKLGKFGSTPRSSCGRDTILGNALVSLLCTQPGEAIRASRLALPDAATFHLEQSASAYAGKILRAPIAQDPLPLLAEMALFFSPVYDLLDNPSNKVMTTLDQVVSQGGNEAKGMRLLPGALQIVTVGVAQLNLLYGDWTSKLIFDELWKADVQKDCKPTPTEPCTERFYTVAEITVDPKTIPDAHAQRVAERKKRAYERLKDNRYLQRNVLMHALSRNARMYGSGQDLSYQFGIDLLATASVDPDAQLATIFGIGLQFSTDWEAEAEPAREKQPVLSLGCGEKNPSKAGCTKVPIAQILGLRIPLPTKEEFRERTLVYPPLMAKLLDVQSRLQRRIAEYATLDYATLGESDPKSAKARLIQALLIASHN